MFHCPSETVPLFAFPINGIPVVTSLQNIYWGSLKHSQIGHLGQEKNHRADFSVHVQAHSRL